MNDYLEHIEYLESNKIGYYLKRDNDTVIVSSSEGNKVFNFENEEVG